MMPGAASARPLRRISLFINISHVLSCRYAPLLAPILLFYSLVVGGGTSYCDKITHYTMKKLPILFTVLLLSAVASAAAESEWRNTIEHTTPHLRIVVTIMFTVYVWRCGARAGRPAFAQHVYNAYYTLLLLVI
eukprot:9476696-Pyramimonas_sp.AAC.1